MQSATKTPSKTKPSDPGAELEARVCQLWFWDGYFARRSINLQHYYHPEFWQVTDLDLLAFDFGPTLKRRKYIGEAKTGKDKPLDRVIWLRGLMHLTGADLGELTTANAPSMRVRQLAQPLRIVAQSTDDLARREQQSKIDEVSGLGSQGVRFVDELKTIHDICRADQELERAYWFLRSEVWIITPWLGIKQLITLIQRMSRRWVDGQSDKERRALKWLLCEAVCIFALNCVTIASYGVELGKDDFVLLLGSQLSEGLAPARYMEEVSDHVDKFIVGVLTELNAPPDTIKKSQGAFMPTPPNYFEPFVETVQRLADGAVHARHVPRYLDIILFERVLYERPVEAKAINRLAISDVNAVGRLARLLGSFLTGQANLPTDFMNALGNESYVS